MRVAVVCRDGVMRNDVFYPWCNGTANRILASTRQKPEANSWQGTMNTHLLTTGSSLSSRRSFIKQIPAGLGLAAVSFGTLAEAMASVKQRPPVKPLGIALVGLGYYSTDLLAPALQETKNVRLAGIVTGTPAKAAAWKEKYGIPEKNIYSYETFDRIADNPDIDIIYVVLPNSMHAEYTIRAFQAGKHVICEKPMALSVRECASMIEAAEKAGKKFSIGYRMHFEPTTQEIMRIGREQVYGPIRLVTAGAGYREGRSDHWKLKKAYGGGAMMDMGVYSLQAARYATGEEPIAVTAQTFTTRPDMFKEVDETTLFQLEFPSGAVASLSTSFGMNMNYLQATAQNGWYRLDPFSSYSGIKGESKDGPLNYPVINQQAAQMDEFAQNIIDNTPVRVPGEEGLKDMRVVEAIYQSIRTGEKVTLPPIS